MGRDKRSNGVDEVVEKVAELHDAGRKEELLAIVRDLLSAALDDANRLARHVEELKRTLYGRKSEHISPNQLGLGLPAPTEATTSEMAANDALNEPASQAAAKAGKRKSGGGRTELPAHLPRQVVHLPPSKEALAAAGGTMSKWREETSEVLEFVPAHFKVLVYVREIYSNETGAVVKGPIPFKLFDKGRPGPDLVTHVLLSKYRDHLPLYRQSKIFERHGVKLSRNTLVDWVGRAAALLEPLHRLFHREVMNGYVVQADDTKLPVQDRTKAKNIKRGRLWALVGDNDYVVYHYAPDWRAETTFQLLGERVGWLQVDGYKGYQRIFAKGDAIEVGCNMHCRRYFERAWKAKDLRAVEPLRLYQQLYAIERASKQAREGPAARLEHRQRDSKPLFEALAKWLEQHALTSPPSTLLDAAVVYASNHWTALCRPLEDGALELDNGSCERSMRDPAVGRRNWLFAGSDNGARHMAIICSVLETAERHGLDVRLYLRDVLMKIAGDWPQSRLEELMPERWRQLHAEAARQADSVYAAAAASPLHQAAA